jgi:hypothetical protein
VSGPQPSALQVDDVPFPHVDGKGFWISDEEFPVFLHAVTAGVCAEMGLPAPPAPRPPMTVLRAGLDTAGAR